MSKAVRDRVLLLSGGVDSAVILAMHRQSLFSCVFVDYKQPAAHEEYRASRALCDHFRMGLTRMTAEIPLANTMDVGVGVVGPRVVPGRNAALLSLALSYAAHHKCTIVEFGATADDAAEYPDCRAQFVGAFNAMSGPTYGVTVGAPLVGFSKERVVELARQFGVPLEMAWSCYQPTHAGKQCGTCNGCDQMRRAIEAAQAAMERDTAKGPTP